MLPIDLTEGMAPWSIGVWPDWVSVLLWAVRTRWTGWRCGRRQWSIRRHCCHAWHYLDDGL